MKSGSGGYHHHSITYLDNTMASRGHDGSPVVDAADQNIFLSFKSCKGIPTNGQSSLM